MGSMGHQKGGTLNHSLTSHATLYNNHCDWVKIPGGKLAPVRRPSDVMDCASKNSDLWVRISKYWRWAIGCISCQHHSFPSNLFSNHCTCNFIDRLGMNTGMCISMHPSSIFISVSPSLFLFCSLSKDNIRGHKLFDSNSFIPAEHLRNKYCGQRKGIELAILLVSISSLASPYRMGNCVCVLHHFKLTAFHLMGRIIHRWRNRLQAKACVTADVQKAH